ncbi:MAG: NAD(P)H-hydrate dehydratase [Planctomycetes bacterium]|nr:NAD(P)H-hydrate dehydratase [Planctomycetota bacterium]
MAANPIITREKAPLPPRSEAAHKGDVGRVLVVGGCCGEVLMVGAPALAANAALRSGAGLVQVAVPEPLRLPVAILVPCATTRTLPQDTAGLLQAAGEYQADVVALGPGLGESLPAEVVGEFVAQFSGGVVVDADGLNRLAELPGPTFHDPQRVVLTPHPGEMRRLLAVRGQEADFADTPSGRRSAALALVEAFGCTVVLKGHATVVTNGGRLFVNDTGNSGMATAGTGDVLTGVIAALLGQGMPALEAAILGVHLHGLAGDFAAEELGRHAMTALDVVDYLPEAFCEHELAGSE